jgi:hypothetical protein
MLRWQSWLVPLFEPLPLLYRLNFIIAIIVEAYMKVMGLEKGSVRCTLGQDTTCNWCLATRRKGDSNTFSAL